MIGFLKKIVSKVTGREPDWEALESDLIQADLGPRFALAFVERLREKKGLFSGEDVKDLAMKEILEVFGKRPSKPRATPLHVILLVGVNGVGKTTTAAKLTAALLREGHRPRLVAADTFRAAAIEQLRSWGERLGVPVTSGVYGADPAGLAFGAYQEALREGQDTLVIDTAGRQHTKQNLMQELAKISRVLAKQDPQAPHETLLVVDATTGSNALAQAREFAKAAPLTGIVAAKMDGVGTGGALVGIRQELGFAPLWVGVGEQPDDLHPFDADEYAKRLLGDSAS